MGRSRKESDTESQHTFSLQIQFFGAGGNLGPPGRVLVLRNELRVPTLVLRQRRLREGEKGTFILVWEIPAT